MTVSLRRRIFCFSLLIRSEAKCSPKWEGAGTEDIGWTTWLWSSLAAQARQEDTYCWTALSKLRAKKCLFRRVFNGEAAKQPNCRWKIDTIVGKAPSGATYLGVLENSVILGARSTLSDDKKIPCWGWRYLLTWLYEPCLGGVAAYLRKKWTFLKVWSSICLFLQYSRDLNGKGEFPARTALVSSGVSRLTTCSQTKTKAYLKQHQSGQNRGLELFTASLFSIYDWFS